jgi:hypothetical protein
MKKQKLLMAIAIMILGCGTLLRGANPAPGSASNFLTKEQLQADTREMVAMLESIHPDPYLYSGGKIAFHRRFQGILQTIPAAGMSRNDFITLIRPFVAAIADGHTAIVTPYDYDRDRPGGLPLELIVVQDLLCVDRVSSREEKQLIGAKLLAVEGVPVNELATRVGRIRGVESEQHALMLLSFYLWARPYLQQLLPEWSDLSSLRADFELASGEKKSLLFTLPREIKRPLFKEKSKLKLPPDQKRDFYYIFLDRARKTALLKIDSLEHYREVYESVRLKKDIRAEASEAYEKLHGKKAPADLDQVLAGIPSAQECLTALVREMKEAETENLIVDLSKNGGGDDRLADMLVYLLYGKEALLKIIPTEIHISKFSPFFFRQFPGRTIGDINRQYGQFLQYPLDENDYDFSQEKLVELVLKGKVPLELGWQRKYGDSPKFLEELLKGTMSACYTPRKVLVTSSNGTYSAAFSVLRWLWRCGAKLVGTTSAQSGNGFGNLMFVKLKNSGVEMAISKNASIVFPETPEKRVQLHPQYELSYEKYRALEFDENAELLFALEILKEL